ncbi:MAG: HEAT repeat domain-containing protein [Candidatus Micrarchaeota archaeon]
MKRKTRGSPTGSKILDHISGKKLGPDHLKTEDSSAMLIFALDNDKSDVRIMAVRGLSVIALASSNDAVLSKRLLDLLEFHAVSSEHEDVRKECIDALALIEGPGRISKLSFEIGCFATKCYRDKVLRDLEKEREMPN